MKKTPKRPSHKVEIQRVFKSEGQPDRRLIVSWINAALADCGHRCACVVRIVGMTESAELNENYRGKQGPTNVLSFPFEWPEGLDFPEGEPALLGDLVVCAPVVEREALEQRKTLIDHWAHMIVHGILHLMGYDHIEEIEAEAMEAKEIAILNRLHIKNPYIEVTDK